VLGFTLKFGNWQI